MQKFDATIKKIRYFIKRLIAIADFYFSDFFVKSTKKIYKIKNIIIDINSFDLEKREIEKLRKKYNESIEDARITYQDKIAQAREIEQKILRIQFSKKTTFKWFLPLHQILRQKYWWYYKIHTLRHASKTNWCVFAVSLILVSGIISNGISDLLALQKGSIFLAEVPAVQMGNGLSVSITSPKATPEKFYLNSEDFKSETDEKWIPYYFNQDDFGDYSVYLKSQNGVQKITVSSHEIKQSLSEKEQELIDQENKEKERKLSMEAEKKKRQIDSKFTQLLGRWIKKNDAIAQDNNIDANFILKAISLPVFQYKVSNQENEAIDVVDEVVVILNETEWSEESQVSHDEQENTEEENQEQLTRDPSATPQDDKNNIEKVIEEIEYEVIISEDVEEISDIETEVENVEDGDAEEIATPEPAPSDDSGARNDNESENENIISRIFNVIKGKISSKDVMADEEVEYQILDISDEEENVVILNETEWSEESQVSQDEQENTVEESQERLTRDPSATPQDDKNNSRDEKNNSQDDNMEEQDDKNNSNDDNLEENKIEEPDVIMLEELEDGVVVIDDLEEDDVMVVEYEEESAYAESYGETKEDEGIIEKVVDFVKDLFGDDNGEILNQVQDDSLDVVDGIEEVMENINTLPVEDTNITEPTAEEWQDYEVDQTTIELEILEQTEDYIIILQKFVLMDKEYNRFDAQVSVKLGFDGRNYINEWEFSLAGEGNNNSRLNRMYWDVVMEPQEENSADNSEITENNADVKQEVRVKKDGGDDGIATPTARNDNGAQDDSVKELPALKQKIGDVVVNVTDFVLEEAENDSVEVLGVDNWILNQVQDDNMDEQENLKELNMAVIDQEPIITEEAVALIEDENIIRVEHIVAPSSVNRTYFYPDGKAGDLLIDPVLSTSYTGGFATITIQADDGDEADDFKIIFSEADGGASTFQRGQAGGTWATNVCSATTLLTELDQDSDIQTDQTGVMQIIEANATRVVIRNDFTLGSEASTTEEYIIYPSGKIYKNVEFNKSLAGTEARLFFNSANLTGEDQHLAGWHPSTPSTSRGVGTYNDALLIELMSTSTTAIITDYQAPGTPTMTTGTLETTATTTGDFDSDGFNEGFGTYEITATTTASSTIQMRLDGSSTNKYDPSFHVHDFYPRTSSSTLQNEYYDHVVAHYRLDDDAANTAVRDYFNNTNINDGVSSGNTSALTSVISNRGSAFLLDDNGDQFHASSTMLSDWSQGTIEFWYRPNYAFAAAQPAMKFLFGTVATGTANNIYAFVYDDGSTATLEFGLHGATNISTTTITETDDALWPANGWTHLKFIWDETSTSTTAVYVNGEKPTQTTTNNSPNLTTVGENIVFGDYQIGGSYSAEGIYDEVKIYNDAMLPYGAYHTDFVNNYSKPHPDVIFYDGLDSTSDDADYSAGSATRTESGTSATTTNVYENAMEFNASGDYQSFATASNISNSKGSIGMWVKSTDATNPGSNQYLFFADANFNIFYDAFGQINFQYDSSATSTDETDTYDNAWHWVRATWDYDNDNYAIYVDGARQDSDTTSLSAPTLDSDFYVGNNSTPNSNFNGSIDEIFITSSNMTPQISTAFGKPIRQPQLSIDGLQVVGTDYNISNANSPSDYIIQYLGNITTNAYIDIMETAFPMYSNGTGGGTWSNSNAWGGTGNTPSASSTVIILDGDDITFNLDDGATSTTCSDITINSGAELNFATTTAADYRMNVYGDINVDGYFFIDASSNTDNETTVSLINESSVEHGIIVGSTGKLEILGESTVDRDAFVTSYVNDGSHNAYIYCQDGSECSIKFSDISYLGSNSGNRYGIYAYDVDSSDTEYFYADGNEVHHGYQGFHLDYSSSNVIKNNNIYSMTNGITLSNWSNFNLIKNNNVHSNSNLSIYLAGSSNYNSIKDNIIYDNVYGVYFNSSSNDYIVNNTIDSNQNYGVSLSAGADDNIIKNNIISNHPGGGETGISDGGSGTITSHNLFYNNTATGTPGDYATYADPDYTSTTTTSDDFMYVNVDSAALGAGVDIVASSVPGTVNIGARLGYVKNQTDSEEFNAMQHAHDDASLGAGDTVTTYTIDNATSTLSSTTTVVGLYEYFTATDNIIATNDDYVGHYVYMSSGLNRGRYYLIVDTIASSETIYILSKDDDSAFINGDGIIIIDRVYTHIGDSGNSNNVRLSTDGTPTSPITWNTNGTVIVDGENMIGTAIYLNTANYNIINEFNATNCTDDGIMMHLCSGSKIISNNLYNNDNNGLYMNSGSYNYVESNLVYDNGDEGIVSSGDNLIVSSNNSYNNFDTGCYFSGSSDCILKSNSSFANGSRGFDIRSGSNNNEVNNNLSFKNSSSGFYIHDNSDDNYIYNNISLYDTNAGVVFNLSSDNNNIARNNIITNAVDGIDDNGSGNTYDYNYFFNNTENIDGGGAIGNNSITGMDPYFYAVATGTNETAGLTTHIYDSSLTIDENDYVGYGVKITGGTGNGQFAGITSNSASRFFVAPAFTTALGADSTFEITDFTITATSSATTPLGQGCNLDDDSEPGYINIGAKMGYIVNDNAGATSTKYSSLQQTASSTSDLDGGDIITVYATQEATGSFLENPTNFGTYATTTVATSTVPSPDDYIGMYMLMTSGAKKDEYYLIVDTATTTATSSYINFTSINPSAWMTNAIAGMATDDTFKIVDRIYEDGFWQDPDTGKKALMNVTTDGSSSTEQILWTASPAEAVILDGDDKLDYGVYLSGAGGTQFNTFRGFKFMNFNTEDLGLSNPSVDVHKITMQGIDFDDTTEVDLDDYGLVAFWRFSENTGQTAYDQTSNDNDGTLGSTGGSDTNDPTWTSNGMFGSALEFDGVNDYVDVSSCSFSGNFTMTAWIKTVDSADAYIASEQSDEWFWHINNGIRFYNGTGWSTETSSVNNNQWRFVVYTGDGTNINAYVDGILEQSDVMSNPSASAAIYIGTRSAFCYEGIIDEFTIYNRALSASEIEALYSRKITQSISAADSYVLSQKHNLTSGETRIWGEYNMDEAPGQTNDLTIYVPDQETIDSATTTKIYYSVGTNSDALYSSSGLATAGFLELSGDATTTIGVGDEVRVGSNRYYITRRNSPRSFNIQNSSANGGTPGEHDIDFASTSVDIYRAFNDLDDAVDANDGGVCAKDSNHLNTNNLITNNYQLNIACYGDGVDTSAALVYNWTTGPKNYIRIYTPVSIDEVGVNQRHNGKWKGEAYTLYVTNNYGLRINVVDYARVDGLQIESNFTSFGNWNGIYVDDNTTTNNEIIVSNNIVKLGTANDSYTAGINFDDSEVNGYAYNNIIYNWTGGNNPNRKVGLKCDANNCYFYNNTMQNCYTGVNNTTSGVAVAINNITQNCDDGFIGTFNSASDYNISDLSSDAPGGNSKNSTTVNFIASTTDDFRLLLSDSAARNAGKDLSHDANFSFTTDIHGEYRSGSWDIGADEVVSKKIYLMQDGDDITVGTGLDLSLQGQSDNPIVVDALNSTHNYTFNINGTLTANYFRIENTTSAGLNIGSTATITDLSNGTFDNIETGSAISYITVDGSAINATSTFNSIIFDDTGVDAVDSNASTSVRVITNTPLSAWYFRSATGTISGEAYDEGDADPGYIMFDDSKPADADVANASSTSTWYSDAGLADFTSANLTAGLIDYYRYTFDQTSNTAIADCSSGENQWASTTASISPSMTEGSNYLHVLSCNPADSPADQGVQHYGPYQYDNTTPVSTTTSITLDAYYSAMNTISGTSTDSGSELDYIKIAVKDETNNLWAASTTLSFDQSSIDWVPNTTDNMTGTTTWTYDATTDGITWTSGVQYSVQSRATDNATLTETSAGPIYFYIDSTAPTSVITAPTDNGYYNTLTSLTGTSTDANGSGTDALSAVEISIKNSSDTMWWSATSSTWTLSDEGSSWASTTITSLPDWSYNFNNADWTTNNEYLIKIRGTDQADPTNQETAGSGSTFIFDTTMASSAITSLVQDRWYDTLTSIAGTSTDNGSPTPSAVDAVKILIQDTTDNEWWCSTSSAWSAVYYDALWYDATGTTTWSISFNDSDWVTDHGFRIKSRATDNAENEETDPSAAGFNYYDINFDTASPTISSFTSAGIDDTQVLHTWSASDSGSGLQKFVLYYIDALTSAGSNASSTDVSSEDFSSATIATTTDENATTWTQTGLSEGTWYYYRLEAVDDMNATTTDYAQAKTNFVPTVTSATTTPATSTSPYILEDEGIYIASEIGDNDGISDIDTVHARIMGPVVGTDYGTAIFDWTAMAQGTQEGTNSYEYNYNEWTWPSASTTSYGDYIVTVRAVDSIAGASHVAYASSTIYHIGESPTSLTLTRQSDERVDITWLSPGKQGIDSYQIHRRTDNGDFAHLATTTSGTLVYSDTSVDLGVNNYSYMVRVYDESDNYGEWSATASTSDIITVNSISDIQTTATTSSGITITWTTSVDSDSYVEYGTTISYTDLKGKDESETSHSVDLTGLSANTEYHFRVKSKDTYGNDANSGDYTFTTLEATDNTPPSISSVATSSPLFNGITVTWTTDENSNSMVDFGETTSYGSTQGDGSDNTTSHTVNLTGLTASTTYYFRVRSMDGSGNTATDDNSSAGYIFQTEGGAGGGDETAPVISAVATSSITATQATITWTTDEASDSIVGYSTTQGSYTTELGSTATTTSHSVNLINLTPGLDYYFRVRSTDDYGNRATDDNSSDSYMFTTSSGGDSISPDILNVSVGTPTGNTVVITWTTNEPATSYVDFATTAGIYTSTQGSTATTTSHSVTVGSLAVSSTYYARVRSADDSDNEAVDNDSGSDYSWTTTGTEDSACETCETCATCSTAGGGGMLIIDKSDKISPTISNINLDQVGDTYANVSWRTDESANSIIAYGFSSNYSEVTANFASLKNNRTSHSVNLKSLSPSSTYHFSVISIDSAGNLTASSDQTFTTVGEGEAPELDIPIEQEEEIKEPTSLDQEKVEDLINRIFNETNASEEMIKEAIAKVTEPPIITATGPQVIKSESESATIAWVTHKKANSVVSYYTETDGERSAVKETGNYNDFTEDHEVVITGLAPGTVYTYQVKSTDLLGNTSVSEYKDFSTRSEAGISNVEISDVGLNEVTISWTTSIITTSIVEYGDTEAYGDQVVDRSTSYTNQHVVKLTGLDSGQVYNFRVKGFDEINDLIYSDNYTFQTYAFPQITSYELGEVTAKSAVILWQTSTETDSIVEYINARTNEKLIDGSVDLAFGHEVLLDRLFPGTTYTVNLKGRDIYGNEVLSEPIVLATSAKLTPLEINRVKSEASIYPGKEDQIQAIITWTTDDYGDSIVIYNEGIIPSQAVEEAEETTVIEEGASMAQKYITLNATTTEGVAEELKGELSANQLIKYDSTISDRHIMIVSDLEPAAIYQFKVASRDANNNLTISKDFTILTPAKKKSIIQVIIANLEETFGWVRKLGI